MITLDLFESDDKKPQAAYVPVGPHYPGSKNRALGNANIAAIMKSLDTPNVPPVTLNFLDGTSRLLTSEEINLIADYYDTFQSKADRANFIYRTLLSRNKMFQLLYRLKQQQLDFSQSGDGDQEPPEPEQLTLFKEQKKSSEEKFKSTRLDRLKTQARAKHPSAASDTEALVADFVDQQDQDQQELDKVKTVNSRQDDLLKQITALNKSQEKEIDNLEAEENNLQQNIQQLRAANAELAKKLAGMSARRKPEEQPAAAQPQAQPAPITIVQQPAAPVPAGTGVSVATDKQKPTRNMRYVPIGGQVRRPVRLAQPSVGSAEVGGQQADIFPSRLKATPVPQGLRRRMQEVQDIPFGMTEDQSIPAKAVIQGYTVDYDPVRRLVTVSRRGQLVGRALNKPGTHKNYMVVINRIIDDSEDDKYPDDLEARSVERPFGESSEVNDLQLRHQRLADLSNIKRKIEKLQAQATRGGRILPRGLAADLEDYFSVNDVDTAYDDMMSKYQKQLGALEQYLGMRKVLWSPKKAVQENTASTAYQEGGRAAYYGRPNNNPYESGTKEHADYNRGYQDFKDEGKDYLRELEVDRSGQPMYQAQDVYMLTHNGREIAFYKLKDLKRAEQDAREMQRKLGGEVHLRKVMRETEQQPGDDILKNLFRDFGEIFGKQPQPAKSEEPEKKEVNEMGRAGYNPLTSEKHWHEVERYLSKMINEPGLDPETRKEFRQRYLEKRREAQQKGWAK